MKILPEWREGVSFPPYEVEALQAGVRQIISNLTSLQVALDQTESNGGYVAGFKMSLQEERARLADYKELVKLCKKRDQNGRAR